MSEDVLKSQIKTLIRSSSISDHQKRMVRLLLPAMDITRLRSVLIKLTAEKRMMELLDSREDRLELKYAIMVEKVRKSKDL